MRALIAESHGKPLSDQLKLTTLPVPTLPTPSHVLIRVLSAALNPIDKVLVAGELESLIPLPFPHQLCFDVAGVIDSVGASVTRFKAGDEVYARVDHDLLGTAAEYCVTSEGSVALKPASLSFDEAASLPLVTLTALQAMRDIGGLTAGQSVLILGGTGGVGTAAIQLARILGASEIVTTQSSHFDRSLQLGATKTIDYKTEKWAETVKGMDLVLDTTGEANAAFSTLKKGGVCVSIIAALTPKAMKDAGMEISMTMTAMLAAGAAPVQANALLHGVRYEACWMKPSGVELEEVRQWVEGGKMRPVVEKVYALDQYAAAFSNLEEGHNKGKLVLHVADK